LLVSNFARYVSGALAVSAAGFSSRFGVAAFGAAGFGAAVWALTRAIAPRTIDEARNRRRMMFS
jgi:hypothetical protein